MRGFFLRATLLLVFVGVGAIAGQPAYAGGFLPTKAACRAIGGEPSNDRTEYGYYCSTPKQDAQCVRQNRDDEDAECWAYDPMSKKCSFDEWAWMDDDC